MEKYQTFGPRFVAAIIDGLIFLPLGIVNSVVVSLLQPSWIFAHLWLLIVTLLPLFYTIILHTVYGQTFGKMAGKVKVVDLNENPITLHHAVLRTLPQIFFSFGVIFYSRSNGDFQTLVTVLYAVWTILDIIVFFVNDQRRALHDFLAGTVVIKLK